MLPNFIQREILDMSAKAENVYVSQPVKNLRLGSSHSM